MSEVRVRVQRWSQLSGVSGGVNKYALPVGHLLEVMVRVTGGVNYLGENEQS